MPCEVAARSANRAIAQAAAARLRDFAVLLLLDGLRITGVARVNAARRVRQRLDLIALYGLPDEPWSDVAGTVLWALAMPELRLRTVKAQMSRRDVMA